MILSLAVLAMTAVLTAPAIPMAAAPEGTVFEVRLDTPAGSRESRPGDGVVAILMHPIVAAGEALAPAGARLNGEITAVRALGWGLRHRDARLTIRFTDVSWPGDVSRPGGRLAVDATVIGVSTARERVDREGTVHGIVPAANLPTTLAAMVWRWLLIAPQVGVPVLVTKLLVARSPDVEIRFPRGTELSLRLAATSKGSPAAASPAIAKWDPASVRSLRQLVERMPTQRARSQDGDGTDLINIAILGTEASIAAAFAAAGWQGTDPRNVLACAKLWSAIGSRHGYARAPISPMMIDGRKPDLAWQKSLNTFSRRHHIRMWRTAARIQGQEVWVGAATEDTGLRFRPRRLRFTHLSDPHIDKERTKVVNDLAFTRCVRAASLVSRAADDSGLETDGLLAAVELNDCREPRLAAGVGDAVRSDGNVWRKIAHRVHSETVRANFVSVIVSTVRLPAAGVRHLMRPARVTAPASYSAARR